MEACFLSTSRCLQSREIKGTKASRWKANHSAIPRIAFHYGMDVAAGNRAEATFLYSGLRSCESPPYCAALEIDLALTLPLPGDAWERPPGSAAVHVLLCVCANTAGL